MSTDPDRTAETDHFPDHWFDVDWEQKARENPLSAVMTTEEMQSAPAEDFSPATLDAFFAKGRQLFDGHVGPLLAGLPDDAGRPLVVEYGCGAGRILKAVVEAGYPCAGIDIAQTMLRHCARLNPEPALYPLDPAGRCSLPSGSAALVYCYAVVQHISRLSNYVTAIDEMCRIVRPGGMLAIQVNCEDFGGGDLDKPDRTENFETYSLHYRAGSREPHQRHDHNEWSGVYIGYDTLCGLLAERGLTIERRYYHTRKKLRGLWVVASKAA
ncbi:MAG TPA: class I SAM-dependent methyltransferase [Opitutaceae bacterium]|nr:class I SAM-dependent methyltransferase [Opitutaceae bacterium]